MFNRTTKKEVECYQKEGVFGVEMETAAVFSVAKFNNIDAVAMLTITDSYAKYAWKKSFDYKKQKRKALESFFEIALKLAC
ncbi:hypothetical protein ACFLYH_01505 [Candidatus Dependentiae bacterium]